MIERYLLRYFLAVVEQGSFSRAATTVGVSQPTLSAGIAKLERQVGVVLFERSNRRVELTVAGTRFLDHARAIEREFAAAERVGEEWEPARLIRLGIASTLSARAVGAAVARARVAEPGVRIEVVEERMRELLAMLDRGRLDAAIGPVPRDRAVLQTLFAEPYMVAMARDHPLANARTIAANAIASEPMIVRRGCEALSDVSRFFTAQGVRPFMSGRAASEERARALIAAGVGITVMPESLGEGLALVPLDGFAMTREVGLIADDASAARLAQSPALAALAEALSETNSTESSRASA